MNIYVVRHGQTDWNKKNILLGNTDKPLNKAGKLQAYKLKEKLENVKFDIIISSNLKRAVTTAKIINNKNEILLDENLKERYYGLLEGTTPKNIHEYWDIKKNLNTNSVEPLEDFLKRIFKEMDFIIQEYNEFENILIVTHYGVIMAIDAYFKEKFNQCFENFQFGNCEYIKYNI